MRVAFPHPTQPIFALCQTFADLDREFCYGFAGRVLRLGAANSCARKQAQNVFAFEDLLTRLDEALAAPGGAALAAVDPRKIPRRAGR